VTYRLPVSTVGRPQSGKHLLNWNYPLPHDPPANIISGMQTTGGGAPTVEPYDGT
jgi:hypothetical protein